MREVGPISWPNVSLYLHQLHAFCLASMPVLDLCNTFSFCSPVHMDICPYGWHPYTLTFGGAFSRMVISFKSMSANQGCNKYLDYNCNPVHRQSPLLHSVLLYWLQNHSAHTITKGLVSGLCCFIHLSWTSQRFAKGHSVFSQCLYLNIVKVTRKPNSASWTI